MKMKKINLTLTLVVAVLLFASCKLGLLNVGLGDKVDILPPGITIEPHEGVQNGAYIHGAVEVHGKVSDDVGAVSVTWMFVDESIPVPAVSPTYTAHLEADNTWWFELDTKDAADVWAPELHADGEKTFTITVTDGAGKSTETRMLLIFDNTPPSATFINPEDGASIYGQVNLRGSSSDNTSLIKVQVRIGMFPSRDDPDPNFENGFTTITGSKYDWVRPFTAEAFKDPLRATHNLVNDTWTLPIYVRVYDYAGNVSTNEPLSNPSDLLYPTKLKEKYGDALTLRR